MQYSTAKSSGKSASTGLSLIVAVCMIGYVNSPICEESTGGGIAWKQC